MAQAQNGSANIFASMPFIPYKIVTALMENDDFCKLIYYNTMDALDKPDLTDTQKRDLIWDGDANRTDKFNIFLTNVQPNEEVENRTIMKVYRFNSDPDNLFISTVCYRFDVLFGSKIPLVRYQGIPCNRGDVIEMEIMKTLNGKDVAGVGCLQFNSRLSTLANSYTGVGNNYTFTGLTIIMATQIADERPNSCQ